ncbi:MAG: flagellin lysine-N-methylase [Clostridia bacterium]|nr:flagellin lysine-N-methylase [Clostridia bacterium]
MEKKGLYAPTYYKDFECIKDKCRHSCCIGWEIDVDGETLKKYSILEGELGEGIRESIACDGTPHFKLVGERCPHLDERGLCKIIISIGEEHLCDICRLHPRFFNVTARGVEVGLGASCEEACRTILSSDEYRDIIEIGKEEAEPVDFDAPALREKVYSVLSERNKPYTERLSEIYEKFSVRPSLLSDREWQKLLSSLEYLDEGNKKLFSSFSSDLAPLKQDLILERALAYFIYRHASSAKSTEEFRTGLTFALFCERLLASSIKAQEKTEDTSAAEIMRVISEEIEYSTLNTDTLLSEIEFALQ